MTREEEIEEYWRIARNEDQLPYDDWVKEFWRVSIRGKERWRKELAVLPYDEKFKTLEKLKQRDMEIAKARDKLAAERRLNAEKELRNER